MRGCGYVEPDPQKRHFGALTVRLSARFARGQGSKGPSFCHMDGVGIFPLFSTLMNYANGARFVGFIEYTVTKGNKGSIVHNIADYKYAIIFITRASVTGTNYASLLAVLTPVKPKLVAGFSMTGFRLADSNTTMSYPETCGLHACQINMNTTSVNFEVTGDNISMETPWIFIY